MKTSERKKMDTYTKEELAKMLKVTPRTIENQMRLGKLPFIKIGRSVRFPAEAIRRHIEAQIQLG
jgi:excisionase family DNA binding protein